MELVGYEGHRLATHHVHVGAPDAWVRRTRIRMGYGRLIALIIVSHVMSLVTANVGIVDDLSHVIEVSGGESASWAITVFNSGTEPRRVGVTVVDFVPDGQPSYVQADTIEGSAASFIEPEVDEFVVAPGENREFEISVDVPETFVESRTLWSALLFEPVDDLQGEPPSSDGLTIRTTTRYAYTVVAHVNDPALPRIVIGDISRVAPRGPRANDFKLDVAFGVDGNRAIGASVQAQVFERTTGNQVLATPVRSLRLYPGHVRTARFDLSTLGSGTYEVVLMGESPGNDLHAVRFDLDVGTAGSD